MSATGPGFAAEDLSLFARIQRVFYAPRTAFTAVRGQESVARLATTNPLGLRGGGWLL